MSEAKEELERVYTIPLSRAWIAARHRRTKRAVNMIREFAEKHMKSSEIKIDTELNERLWNRGITSPPRRITVKMTKDEDGVVTITLPREAKPVEAKETPRETPAEEPKAGAEPAETEEPPQEKAPAETKAAAKPKNTTHAKKSKS